MSYLNTWAIERTFPFSPLRPFGLSRKSRSEVFQYASKSCRVLNPVCPPLVSKADVTSGNAA